MYHKKVENVDHKIWAIFQISEGKMAMLGLFPANIMLLGCTSAIIDFIVSCTLWVFTIKVPFSKNASH